MTVRQILPSCLLLTALVCAAPGGAGAQTDYSPRIRSMGTGLAGIVADPYTDAFLNPARVGDMPGRGAWFGRLPAHALNFIYPGLLNGRYYGLSLFPQEGFPTSVDYDLYVSFTPYSIGLVTPLSRDLKLSLAGEISVDGYNFLEDEAAVGFTYPPSLTDVSGVQDADGRDRGIYHGVFDAALGSGSPDSEGLRWGARAAVGYDRTRYQSVRTTSTLRAEIGSEDLALLYTYNSRNTELERLTATFSFGVFKGAGVFAQAVAGAGVGRETLVRDSYVMREDDEDYDGDGNGPGNGISPLYQLNQDGSGSSREYETARVFGRLGLRWGRRVSSWHRFAYSSSRGDGDGGYDHREVIVDVGSEQLEQEISYMLDGESSGYRFSNAVGFVERLFENVMLACAVEAVIQHDEFEEAGEGGGRIQVAENGSSSRFEGPYTQRATYQRDFWYLSIPVAFEWEINEYAAWRFGADFRASRSDATADITQDTDTMGFPDLGVLPVTNSDNDLRYVTSTYFSSGVTLSFRDRLKLEILMGPSSGSLDLTYFTSAILTFRF